MPQGQSGTVFRGTRTALPRNRLAIDHAGNLYSRGVQLCLVHIQDPGGPLCHRLLSPIPSDRTSVDLPFFNVFGTRLSWAAVALLGFIFLPLTTLVHAGMVNTGQPTAGINLLLLIVAVVADLGGNAVDRFSADLYGLPGDPISSYLLEVAF